MTIQKPKNFKEIKKGAIFYAFIFFEEVRRKVLRLYIFLIPTLRNLAFSIPGYRFAPRQKPRSKINRYFGSLCLFVSAAA